MTMNAQLDFEETRRKQTFTHIFKWIQGKNNHLCSYNRYLETVDLKNMVDRGLQTINVDDVVGSVSDNHNFDHNFMPTSDRIQQRWISIRRAHDEGKYLPPIDVYKVGDLYFVEDGHHRVSVAKFVGQQYIDANVIEMVVSDATHH